jgi:peptidoglycan/xylan/chitin deacetylase (PgdA/CDA1 family)
MGVAQADKRAAGREERLARLVTLLYHDVVPNGRVDDSGFPGPEAASYKLDADDFDQHLEELGRRTARAPVTVDELRNQPSGVPWLLTFDDGGESAVWIGERLAHRGWLGHFFVTVDWIGRRGFVDEDAIRALDGMGHVVGSHSCSHPDRMALCTREQLLDEWGRSVEALSEIIGRPVDVASVPGGYYRPIVARMAAAAGIRTLFNSEPVISPHVVDGCLVLGRFVMRRNLSAQTAAQIACATRLPRARQFAFWKAKRAARAVGGEKYLRLRSWLLTRR